MAPQNARILVIGEDAGLLRQLSAHLTRRRLQVIFADGAEEAVRLLHIHDPALVLLDAPNAGARGTDTLERVKQVRPDVRVMLLAAGNDPQFIFRVSKLGADDYVSKPIEARELSNRIARLMDTRRHSGEITHLREQVRRHSDFAMLFGTSPKMEEVKLTIEKVADTTATVLIRGESGTGKEMVARLIYGQSSRRHRPFVKVNCAAIPHELLESELFGYEPGAFTGANRQKQGKFDQANQGTIFLDEIGEMHPALQAKLLHVLQDGSFARLGGKRDIAVDVRVLAATNQPLERAVAEGQFREDLFYRINVVTINIPPLRERREEVPVFLDFFLRKYSEFYGKQPAPFSDYAVGRMVEYGWPGNIRELENLVKRYVIVGNEPGIIHELSIPKPIMSAAHVQPGPVPARPPAPAAPRDDGNGAAEVPSLLEIGRRAALQAEREAIERTLAQTRWNRRQAAKILKVSYKALLNKLKAMEEQDQVHSKQRSA